MSEQVTNLAYRLLRSNAELVAEYEDDARESAKRLRTGFKTICTGDYKRGEEMEITIPRKAITFFVGKSGGGKTTGMLNFAMRLIQQGHKGAFITLEEPGVDLFSKMMSLYSRNSFRESALEWDTFNKTKHVLGNGFMTWRHAQTYIELQGDQFKFIDATKHIEGDLISPTSLEDPRLLCELLDRALELGDVGKFDFIMLDYAQLLDTGSGHQSTALMMKEVARVLRKITGKHSAALILGAQLNREAAFKDFEKWQKEHIAEGSDLEKAANTILAFCLKSYDRRTMMGIRCLKNRGGNPCFQSLHDCDLKYYWIDDGAHHDPDAMG